MIVFFLIAPVDELGFPKRSEIFRSTSELEDFHRAIYNALGLSGPDCKKKILYL